MPSYKLTYFDARGRAELSRLIFAEADREYTDKRIPKTQWPEIKKSTPFGQLPLLEVDGHVIIGQSTSIARFLANRFDHSSDWLHALPLSACGLRMDDETLRISVSIRLGARLCEPHTCICGAQVDFLGLHGLACKKSTDRTSRHNYVNDILWRALCRAGVPSIKEPSGLTNNDGKRPDGLTQIPWDSGRCATWDVTVTDTFAASNLHHSALVAGLAGRTDVERAQADMIVDCIADMMAPSGPLLQEQDETKKAELREKIKNESLPNSVAMLEKLLVSNKGGNSYFVGDSITWADLKFIDAYKYLTVVGLEPDLSSAPKLKALKEKVERNARISRWLKTRPETPM